MTVKFKVPLAALTALVFVVAIVTLNSGNQRTKLWLSDFPDEDRYEFPKGFLWGAASAAQHIETQQNSDWTEFEIDAAKNGRSGTGVKETMEVQSWMMKLLLMSSSDVLLQYPWTKL